MAFVASFEAAHAASTVVNDILERTLETAIGVTLYAVLRTWLTDSVLGLIAFDAGSDACGVADSAEVSQVAGRTAFVGLKEGLRRTVSTLGFRCSFARQAGRVALQAARLFEEVSIFACQAAA